MSKVFMLFFFPLKFFKDRRWPASDWYVLKEKSELYLIMVDCIKTIQYLHSLEELFFCLILKNVVVPCIGKYLMGRKLDQFVLLT